MMRAPCVWWWRRDRPRPGPGQGTRAPPRRSATPQPASQAPPARTHAVPRPLQPPRSLPAGGAASPVREKKKTHVLPPLAPICTGQQTCGRLCLGDRAVCTCPPVQLHTAHAAHGHALPGSRPTPRVLKNHADAPPLARPGDSCESRVADAGGCVSGREQGMGEYVVAQLNAFQKAVSPACAA